MSFVLGIFSPLYVRSFFTSSHLLYVNHPAQRIVFHYLYHDLGILLNFLIVCMNELTKYNKFLVWSTSHKSIGAVWYSCVCAVWATTTYA